MAQAAISRGDSTIEIPGTLRLDDRQVVLQRRAVLALTLIPFAGFLAAAIMLWGSGLNGVDLSIFLVTYVFTGLGVTVGYHRLLTHQSFDAVRWLRLTFAIAGSMAVEGSVVSWVANHRRHHAFSDQEGDPHSPHLEGREGIKGAVTGLWHAHVGWLFDEEKTAPERWAPDLLKDPAMVRIDRIFPLLVIGTFVLPAVVGFVLTGSVWGAISAFLWGGLARVFLLHHVTWSINSICHFYGKRPFETPDYSTNNWPLALISFGESWHNNHHAFPSAAVHGLARFQLDLSGIVITGLERFHLASNVRRVSSRQLDKKYRG